MSNSSKPIVKIENLTWGYPGQHVIFDKFDFSVSHGDFYFLIGTSGAGKTSLMKLITGEITPPAKTVFLQDDDISRVAGDELQSLRRRIGVVYQDYKLLTDRSAIENIILPLQLHNVSDDLAKEQARVLAKEFNFLDKLHTKVSLLSGGEKQKVAIMRAIISRPQVIFADEPTGNLDREASRAIADMMIQANKKGHTIVFVTHDRHLIDYVQDKHPGVKVATIE